MEILRERNIATTIYFPLIVAGGTAFATSGDWTPAAGDADFSKDGAAFGSTNGTVVYEGNGMWSLALLATEVDGKVTMITIQDTEIEDQAVIVQTYGDTSAGIVWSYLADYILRRSYANARTSTRGETATGRNLLGAMAHFVNKLYRSGSNLIATQENDTTAHITRAMTTSAAAEEITDLDPP